MTNLLYTSSDWHLRSSVPVSRAERSWYDVMDSKIHHLFERIGTTPLLIAGDLFDRPDPPASLVSWAISTFRQAKCNIFVTCGQHDVPNHRVSDRMQGAYGALVKAGVIYDLPPNEWCQLTNNISVYAMPWNHYDMPKTECPTAFAVAALHKYVWRTPDTKYYGAEDSSNVNGILRMGNTFNAVAIGDNHIPWATGPFVNHGSLFGFSSNQKEHVPLLGMIDHMGDYTSELFPDPIPAQWQESAIDTSGKAASVVQYLATADNSVVNFRESLKRLEDQSDDEQHRKVYRNLNQVLLGGD